METTAKTFEPATPEDQAATLQKAYEPLTDWPQDTSETETNNAARDYYLTEILLQDHLN
jgi:hypothetical protein